MPFAVDDRVVHPLHGVGTVVRLAARRFEAGASRLYYEILLATGATLWVPVDSKGGGLRRLMGKGELARYRNLLSGQPKPLAADHKQRQWDVSARLRAGTLRARCEVVRDLTAYSWKKPLCQSSAVLLRRAQLALDEEWSAVAGIPVEEAARQIQDLLQKGRRAFER